MSLGFFTNAEIGAIAIPRARSFLDQAIILSNVTGNGDAIPIATFFNRACRSNSLNFWSIFRREAVLSRIIDVLAAGIPISSERDC